MSTFAFSTPVKPPEELNKMADLVLNYRPKPKSKSAKKRAKKGELYTCLHMSLIPREIELQESS